MLKSKPILSKPGRPFLTPRLAPPSQEPKQRRMMVIALTLLLVALGFVLYHDREFWFPDSQEIAQDGSEDAGAPSASAATARPAIAQPSATEMKRGEVKRSGFKRRVATANPQLQTAALADPPADATTIRTVLPPLEVEVVAGDVHRTLRPGAPAHLDLQSGDLQSSNLEASNLQPASVSQANSAAIGTAETTASLVSNSAERVEMSAETPAVVSRSVKPGYPLLARQMKVQGSVILQALIGRDGDIQGLHVVSGPPILAGAAQEAVKQWRFKPHYQGNETVETQAKITVNFTISTN